MKKTKYISDMKMYIFDAAGRMLTEFSQSGLKAGSYEYKFEGTNLSSGVYYYKLLAVDFSETKKMVVIK